MAVEFRLLGPVEVWADGQLVNAGEPRRRAVLAALLVDAGTVVSSATLIDRVWGEDPPTQAVKTLGTHITRIRRVLEQAARGEDPVVVVSQSGGYRLTVDRDRVDLHRWRRLVEDARRSGHTDEQRVALLRQAVATWRGEPLAGVPGDWAHRTRDRLLRERLDVMVSWAEAELRVHNPTAVLAPLAELADEHPMMEPLTETLVRALVAARRPGEALERCRTHRQRLADDQGIDQGAGLRALYEAILRGDEQVPGVLPAIPAVHETSGNGKPVNAGRANRGSETASAVATITAAKTVSPSTTPGTGVPAPRGQQDDPASFWSYRLAGRRRMFVVYALCAAVVMALGAAALGEVGSSEPESSVFRLTGRPPTIIEDFTQPVLNESQWRKYEEQWSNGSSWSPSALRVVDGELQIVAKGRNPTGRGNVAGGLNWFKPGGFARTYGVWKVRAKFDVGAGYGGMIGLFPIEGAHERNGMLTLARNDQGDRQTMYPEAQGRDGESIQGAARTGDYTDWAVYSVEWRPDFATISVNGEVIFDSRVIEAPVIIPNKPMFLYMQLKPGPAGSIPAAGPDTPDQVVMHIDWVKYYS